MRNNGWCFIQKYGLLNPTKIKCYIFKTICVVRTNEYNEWGRSFEQSEIRIFVNARGYFGDAVYATSLMKWLFARSLMQVSIHTNIHLISPICNRLHQNSFSQNHFSWSYSHRMIILGTTLAHSLPEAVFWRSCHRRMQERYKVARVKTDGQFGRTSYLRPKGDKSSEMFGEHLK